MDHTTSPHWHDPAQSAPGLAIEECGLEPSEILLLELMRYFCLSFAEPRSFGWEMALERAESELGESDGAQVACAMVRVLRAVRHSRKSTFDFINAGCAVCSRRVRATELQVLRLVRGARNGDIGEMRAAATIVAEGNPIAALLEAASAAARVFNAVFPERMAAFPQVSLRMH